MNKFDNVGVVGLTGGAGCGKDTLAQELVNMGWVRVAFADALKDMCIDYLGLTHDDAYTQEGKMRFNETWGMTNREILQKVGTDAMRNGFNDEVWVKIAGIKIKKYLDEGKKVVVTDCRFDNEAELCESLGGICVKIVRPSMQSNLTPSEQKHASEAGINEKLIAFEINNNSTVEAMRSMFLSKLKTFEKRHVRVAQRLEECADKRHETEAQSFLLYLKKWFGIDCGELFGLQNNDGVVIEWQNYNGYEIAISAHFANCKIRYRICKTNTSIGHEGEFCFDDYDGWKSMEKLLLATVVNHLR